MDEIKEVEYKLDYTQVYNEYKVLFEQKIESFIENQGKYICICGYIYFRFFLQYIFFVTIGVSVADFFEIIQAKTVLDSDCSEAFFGQMLLAVTEFDVFMVMMKEAAQAKTPFDPDAAAAAAAETIENESKPSNNADAKADSK